MLKALKSQYLSLNQMIIENLISQSFVAIGKVDDATIGKAMLQDVVLHDEVVFMGVDADVCIMREAEVHDAAEDSVNIRIAGYTMYDMIGKGIVCPLTIIYL